MHSNKASAENSVTCPALFISAPSSGEGKTTITSALARYFKNQGKVVRVFKTGPDYLDPQILEQASGNEVQPLDLWMAGDAWCREKLFNAAQSSDLILIEGAMGLFDGDPSSADLAAKFGIPVVVVMNVKGMAQTAGAVVSGLANFKDDFNLIGMIANNCATHRHRELIELALPDNISLIATFARDEAVALPERHLGLVQASEVADELEARFESGAQGLIDGGLNSSLESSWLTPIPFTCPAASELQKFKTENWLKGKTIAIAKDKAFSFIYQSNVSLLENMGANIEYFSPLQDARLPKADALWFAGGYPELYAQTLAKNESMLADIQAFFQKDKAILAECGGLLYCLETLTDLNDQSHNMLGLLNGHGSMKGKRGCQGMQTACLPEGLSLIHISEPTRPY